MRGAVFPDHGQGDAPVRRKGQSKRTESLQDDRVSLVGTEHGSEERAERTVSGRNAGGTRSQAWGGREEKYRGLLAVPHFGGFGSGRQDPDIPGQVAQ